MLNPHRGDVRLVINGEPVNLRLTLGALAALEDRLNSGSLIALAERFDNGNVGAGDLLALLAAGALGGGCNLSEGDLANAEIEGGVVAAMRAGVELMSRAFQPDDHAA